MSIIKNYSSEFKIYLDSQNLSKNTIKNYISSYNSLQDIFKQDNIDFIKKPEETYKAIEKVYPKSNVLLTKINIILLIIKIFYNDIKDYEKYNKKYIKYRDILKDIIDKEYKSHEASDKQKEKAISIEENEKIMNTLLNKIKYNTKTSLDIINIRNYLIYAFINDMHTRGDFILSKLILFKSKYKYNDDYNYIVINKKDKTIKYIQNKYKTVKYHGQKIHNIDNNLYKYFLKLYNAYKKLNVKGDYAFYQDNLENQMNTDNLSKIYTKIGEQVLGKKISLQVARVQDASINYEENENTIIKANKQGHSLETHNLIYSKKDINKK
jgi:hypothetical protein